MIRFSIIMPCFNVAATLDETISSLVVQSYPHWELICIDDGSEDETIRYLNAWAKKDKRIQVLRARGKGPSAARNQAASLATGDILSFCDADDLWVEDKLEQLVKAFSDPRIGGAYGRIAFFKLPGRVETYSSIAEEPLQIADLLGENPVCTMSNFSVRRSLFRKHGGLREDMVHNEDLDWLIRLTGLGTRIVGLNRLHVWYRTSGGGLSSDLVRMARSRRQALATAAQFGLRPSPENEAIYLRYLARRALRLERAAGLAFHLTLKGLRQNPRAFLFPLRRGGATALAACLSPLLPASLRRVLFAQ